MKKLTHFLVAAMFVAGGAAMAQTTATQTVTGTIGTTVSISVGANTLDLGGGSGLSAGTNATGTATLTVSGNNATGFNIKVAPDSGDPSAGFMCEATSTGYTTSGSCLSNFLQVAGSSTDSNFTTTGVTTGSNSTALTSTGTQIFAYNSTITSGTVTATYTQPIAYADKVLASGSFYQAKLVYTIAANP